MNEDEFKIQLKMKFIDWTHWNGDIYILKWRNNRKMKMNNNMNTVIKRTLFVDNNLAINDNFY